MDSRYSKFLNNKIESPNRKYGAGNSLAERLR